MCSPIKFTLPGAWTTASLTFAEEEEEEEGEGGLEEEDDDGTAAASCVLTRSSC